MTWFLVNTDETKEYISKHDPSPEGEKTVWVIHPPSPYKAARMTAEHASADGVDISDLDPDSGDFASEYIKRALKTQPVRLVDNAYDWCLIGLSEIRPHGEEPITEITRDFLEMVPHDVIREIGDEIAKLSQVDQELEGNSDSPSESKH